MPLSSMCCMLLQAESQLSFAVLYSVHRCRLLAGADGGTGDAGGEGSALVSAVVVSGWDFSGAPGGVGGAAAAAAGGDADEATGAGDVPPATPGGDVGDIPAEEVVERRLYRIYKVRHILRLRWKRQRRFVRSVLLKQR